MIKQIIKLFISAAVVAASALCYGGKTFNPDYSQLFKNYEACFILYNLNEHKIISEYNPNNRCSQRIPPDSTFKIALSLMAFNQSIITQNTIFKWDGKQRELPDWNQDQTPATWLRNSVVWVSQQITPQLGDVLIRHYLAGFDYGNQNFSGDYGKNNGLLYAWLSGSLKISAVEQLNFLDAMLSNQLPISREAVANTQKNLYLGKLADGTDYFGKTGSGRHGRSDREDNPSKLRDGWFVGFIEKNGVTYIFVSNLTDKSIPAATDKFYGGVLTKQIAMQLLNTFVV